MIGTTLKLFKGTAIAVLLTGTMLSGASNAETVRTGPNGQSVTINREVVDDGIIRTTTGPEGQQFTTTREAEDGVMTTTTTGPNGEIVTIEAQVTEDGIVREAIGTNGNTWTPDSRLRQRR